MSDNDDYSSKPTPTAASIGAEPAANITTAARTVLDDTTVAAMVDTLGGAATTGTGGIARAVSPVFTTPNIGSATGSISGNAATVTTNANLTGPVTSTGNATAIANNAITKAMTTSNTVKSTGCGNFSGTSTTYADITNLSAAITTLGRPVLITLEATDLNNQAYILSPAATGTCVALFRGATQLTDELVVYTSVATNQTAVAPGCVCYIDTPAAGTYTYKAQYKVFSAGTAAFKYISLRVTEL